MHVGAKLSQIVNAPREVCHDSAINFVGPSASASPAPLQTDRWLRENCVLGKTKENSQLAHLGALLVLLRLADTGSPRTSSPMRKECSGLFCKLLAEVLLTGFRFGPLQGGIGAML